MPVPDVPSRNPRRFLGFAAALLVLLLWPAASPADAGGDTTAAEYRTPDATLTALIDAPPTPGTSVGPRGEWIALLERPSLPPISELSGRELRLAGQRIDPAVSGPSRSRPLSGLSLLKVADGSRREITGLPAEPRLGDVTWSSDGSHMAFTHTTDERIELWVAERDSGEARRLADVALNQVGRYEPTWLPDGSGLVVALVPADRGAEPQSATVPAGPVIQQNLGRTAPARTYQDLLEDSYDEALFEHYMGARVARVSLDGEVTRMGEAGLIWDFDVSPDGRFLLVEQIHRPFSYLVPAFRFPRRTEVWDMAGETVKVLADVPLQDEVSMAFSSTTEGPRNFQWRSDEPATAVWVEALDGGDANRDVEERDRLFQLAAPFTGEPEALATFGLRFGGVEWGRDDLALAYTWWWSDRTAKVWRLRPGVEGSEPELLLERSFEDRYNDPGNPVTRVDDSGHRVLLAEGDSVFMIGEGASDEGNRPFLDVWDLESGEKTRLFRSEAPFYERPLTVLDAASRTVLTLREAVDVVPQMFVRSLADQAGASADEPRQLTDFPHPSPQLEGISKELIRYKRADGVDLNGTLYLPAGYDAEADGPLPLVLWAYPQEFKSADAAGQITDSPYRFARVGWWSPLLWLTQGYAVLDDPTLPIIGEGDEEPNDTYVDQLVAGAQAAVDAVVARGVADPERVAIGGHSYGAFMTANLLAHSDIFAAGIARSGAYNRTLTPFGFQAEERSLWDAPEVYFAMSPFMHAEKVNEPILLIHGDSDNNSGTFPMQSERYYNALKGHGATARLVMLPHESHGYRARESVLHMLWESGRWLDDYVKNRQVGEEPAEGEAGAASGAL